MKTPLSYINPKHPHLPQLANAYKLHINQILYYIERPQEAPIGLLIDLCAIAKISISAFLITYHPERFFAPKWSDDHSGIFRQPTGFQEPPHAAHQRSGGKGKFLPHSLKAPSPIVWHPSNQTSIQLPNF